VAPDLGLIMYARPSETARSLGLRFLLIRLAERGLADARETDQATDRPGQLFGACWTARYSTMRFLTFSHRNGSLSRIFGAGR